MKQRHILRGSRVSGLVIVLGLMLTMLFSTVSVMAAETDELTETPKYTVRVYAGNQGTIEGGDVKTIPNVENGTTVAGFSVNSAVQVKDNRYYPKGIRESGADNSTFFNPANGIPNVQHDTDYVVAYGIRGTNVAYTVNYVRADGSTLANSDTFYGNVGDVPVVAYKHIEGYYPNARNITDSRGLSQDPAQNVFTFTYQTVPQPTAAPAPAATTQTTILQPAAGTGTTPGTTGTEGGAAGTEGAAATGGAAGTGAADQGSTQTTLGGEGAAAGEGGAAGAGGAAAQTAPAAAPGQTAPGTALPASPEEIPEVIDIAEQEVPLANAPSESDKDKDKDAKADSTADSGNTTEIEEEEPPASGLSTGAKAGIGVAIGAAAAIAAALVAYLKKRTP